ncbi:aldo/keto reductase [Nocardiopsis sp. CNT-189]|uniref:aldo/keto reductase n=1 Tax=Nocardiopsis oceanisediminis TaxID=2816862 RepID=UPI003B2FEA4A
MRYRTIGTGAAARRVSTLCLGALPFGTAVDEADSFALLDRFAEAGGTFVDTSDAYSFWLPGRVGGESEAVLGRWLRSRGAGGETVVATKAGARPAARGGVRPRGGAGYEPEGLSAAAVRAAVAGSLERLGTDRIDLLYAHVPDPSTPLAETAGVFADLVEEGAVGLLGISNHEAEDIGRARAHAAARPRVEVAQYRHSYLRPLPGAALPESAHVHTTPELLGRIRAEGMPLVAYSTLISGAYTRADRPLPAAYDHPGTRERLRALDRVAAETGATRNQVVLAWLMGGPEPVVPLVGASTLAQLDEVLAAAELDLTAEQRELLDTAG